LPSAPEPRSVVAICRPRHPWPALLERPSDLLPSRPIGVWYCRISHTGSGSSIDHRVGVLWVRPQYCAGASTQATWQQAVARGVLVYVVGISFIQGASMAARGDFAGPAWKTETYEDERASATSRPTGARRSCVATVPMTRE